MKHQLKRLCAIAASIVLIFSIAQPAYAEEDTEISGTPSVSEIEARSASRPHQLINATNLSGGKRLTFSGNTLGGVVYTNSRFKGKTNYKVKFTTIQKKLKITVYKFNGILSNPQYTTVTTTTLTSNGALFSFRTSSTKDELYLGFSSTGSSKFSGYVY